MMKKSKNREKIDFLEISQLRGYETDNCEYNDTINKHLNLGLLRPTQMKNNPRVIMPDPLSTKEENIMTTIETIVLEST